MVHTSTYRGLAVLVKKRIDLEVNDSISTSNLIQKAKIGLGISKCRHRKSDYGDAIRLDLVGLNQVVFIYPKEQI